MNTTPKPQACEADRANASMNPSLFNPIYYWQELKRRQATLSNYAVFMLGLMLVALLLHFLDDRIIRDVPVWVKPIKFMAATIVMSLTTAWFIPLLPVQWRNHSQTQWMVRILIFSSGFEVFYISWQAALGQASHYNNTSVFYMAMYALMGIMAVVLTATQGWLGWKIYKTKTHTFSTYELAVVQGLLLTCVLTVINGFLLGGQQPQAGMGVPLLGWHLAGADLRPAHFLSVHAEQIIPWAGFLLLYFTNQTKAKIYLYVIATLYLLLWLVFNINGWAFIK